MEVNKNNRFDAIVVGIGGVGSSTAYYLAKAGHKVLGIERSTIPNKFGSSHGESRIIRKSYFGSETYTKLIEEAYSLWNELEKISGKRIIDTRGGITIGKASDPDFQEGLKTAKLNTIIQRVYNSEEINKEFPLLHLGKDYMGLYEKTAGILNPDICVDTYKNEALKTKNAQFLENIEVTKIEKDKITNTYILQTKKGETYQSK